MSKPIPKAVAPYYKSLSREHKLTMLEMRSRILQEVPSATEIIKYGMPTFVFNGSDVAGIMSHKNHIGYYPYSGSIVELFPEIMKKYKTSKGAIQIELGKPLPKSTIHKLIRARISKCPVARGEVDLSKYEKVDSEWRSIGLSAPARRGLINNNMTKLSHLAKWREIDLMKIHGMGPKALTLLAQEMKKKNLSFK